MSKKRRRDPSTVDTQMVEIYEDLSNENEEIRLKAAQSLLRKFSVESSPSKERLTVVLTRLIRGLCSGRKAARLGFSVAFTEFLVQQLGSGDKTRSHQLTFSEIFDCLKKQTDVEGKASGQEEKDQQLGRIFGAEAVIKSGVLFNSGSTSDTWSQVLDLVYELAQKKAWLREECGWILYRSIQDIKVQPTGLVYAQVLIDKLVANNLARSPEGVAIWLGVLETFPSVILPSSIWKQDNPLHRKEKSVLGKIMKEASTSAPQQAKASNKIVHNTTWSPNLHFAWDIVVASILKRDDNSQGKVWDSISFADFWTEAVDDGLFSASASDQRKYWGFVLFQRAIHSAPASLISVIFSQNFMRCFTNQLASSDRYLHRNAEKAVKAMHARVEAEPRVALTVLTSLLRPPNGRINFDQITKTKTVERLLIQVDDRDLKDLFNVYPDIISYPNTNDEKTAAVNRQIAADHLLTVTRTKQTIADKELSTLSGLGLFTTQVLVLFAKHAYFVYEQQPSLESASTNPPISEATRSVFRSRISSCLAHLLAKCAQPATIVYDLIYSIRSQAQKDDQCKLLFEPDATVSKSMDKSWAILQKVHAKVASASGSKKRFLGAFELLYALTILQIYNGDADAVSILDELKSCYVNLVKHKSRSEQASSDALVEILLSFVAKPSSLFRRLACQVFSAYTTDVSEAGIQSMIKVLATNESVIGQNELFDQDNEDGSDDPSDVEAAEVTSSAHEGDSSNDLSAETTDEDNVDSSAAAAEELAAFDAKLALALGTRPPTNDLDANDDDGSSDEDMDDEQMEALDEHLEKVFRERKKTISKKTQNNDAKEAIINFKCRVLELLVIYIKQEHKNLLGLQLLVPVLKVIHDTKSTLVSSKACDLVGHYFKLCKPNSAPAIPDAEAALSVLRSVHQQAGLEGSNAYSSACSRASLLLVKVLTAQDRENLRQVESVYSQSHENFMLDAKSRTKPSFFSDWLNWSVTARKS